MMKITGLLLCVCVFGCVIPVWSQSVPVPADSTAASGTRFGRIGINTYTGQSFFNYARSTAKQQYITQFRHSWIYNISASLNQFVRNDVYFQFAAKYQVKNSLWHTGPVLEYSAFKANQTVVLRVLQELSRNFRPDSNWQVSTRTYAGLRRDSRFDRTDHGPDFGSILQVKNNTATIGGQASVNKAYLGPRIFSQVQTEVFYSTPQYLPASAIIRAGYYALRSADYLTDNTQTIASDTLFTTLESRYKITESVSFRTQNRFALPRRWFLYRTMSASSAELQNTGYVQSQLETENQLRYDRPRLQAALQFTYRERSRLYDLKNNLNLSTTDLKAALERERIKDVLEKVILWNGILDWKVTARHILSAQATAQLLRLDTPSPLNNQDRDEVYYLARTAIESNWSGSFRTSLVLAAERKQFVFIKSQQSIENYSDHVLRWEPGFTWQQGPFSWVAALQLWATYHVRNIASEQLKNRSTRTFIQTHTIAWQLPRRFRLQALYTRRENQTGLLNWQAFSESPLDTVRSHDLSLTLEKRFFNQQKQGSIKLGYRYFWQGHFFKGSLNHPKSGLSGAYLHEATRQHGPELSGVFKATPYLDASATVWLQVVSNYYTYSISEQQFAGIVYTPAQLDIRRQVVYPYFNASVVWYFARRTAPLLPAQSN